MLHAPLPAALVESLGPEGAWDGLADPLDEGLAQKRWTSPAPVDPGLVPAAFGHGRDASVLLERRSAWEAFAELTKCCKEARRERRTGTGQGAEDLVVGQLGADGSDLDV